MTNLLRFILFLFFFIFSLYILRFSEAAAQSPVRSFTIVPPSVTQPLLPGSTAEGVLKMQNDTDEPVTFNVTIRDFIVSDTQGTPTILPNDTLSNKYSASSWIGVSPNYFTLQAHKRQELNYYMQIPTNARPGGHYAAVVYAPLTTKGVDSTGATVNSQIGTLFLISIAGDIKQQSLVTRFFAPFFQEYGPVAVQTQIKNMGDEHVRPIGTVTITNMLGGKTTQQLKENNIFPEAARDYVNLFGEKFMIGRYVAHFDATYGRANNLPLVATVAFWVFPWKIVLVIILLIAAAVLGVMLMRKSAKGGSASGGKKDGEGTPTPPTPSES